MLLPIQVLFLHVPSPAVTATNLLYNIISTPAGALTFRRAGRLDTALTRALLSGTLPGVIVGTVVRLTWLASEAAFSWVAGAVLCALGARLAFESFSRSGGRVRPDVGLEEPRYVSRSRLVGVGSIGGFVGGIYGLGGAAILVPWLVGVERLPVHRVAGAALVTTLATSVVGVATFVLANGIGIGADSQPDWPGGIALGIGGALGSALGAYLQPRLPVRVLRSVVGAAAIAAGVRLMV